jgi:hypothetical protein
VVRVRMLPPTALRVSQTSTPVWSMARGLWRHERSLLEATRWAYRVMCPRRRIRGGRDTRLRAK